MSDWKLIKGFFFMQIIFSHICSNCKIFILFNWLNGSCKYDAQIVRILLQCRFRLFFYFSYSSSGIDELINRKKRFSRISDRAQKSHGICVKSTLLCLCIIRNTCICFWESTKFWVMKMWNSNFQTMSL